MTTQQSALHAMIDQWADKRDGPVALHLKEKLLPIEGAGGVIFPPTYADVGYNIDDMSDGTKVATIDSVGSQANRMEPLFKLAPYSKLVPQVDIAYGDDKHLSILDAGHRLGDAVVRATDLSKEAHEAFILYRDKGDATKLAKLAPTSIVFGAWDSRDTQAKLPRIVQSVMRAWDVDLLRRSAQYNPALDYAALAVFSEEEKQKAEGKKESPLAQRGFVHVPAPRGLGGVIPRGPIERDVTVNLIALRRLHGEPGEALRRYVLGLALVAAVEPVEAFLRQGCVLVPDPSQVSGWTVVHRDGRREEVALEAGAVLQYAQAAAEVFGVGRNRKVAFDRAKASQDVKPADKKGGEKPKAS